MSFIKQSTVLTMFYREYLKWSETGVQPPVMAKVGGFERSYGLCFNLRRYRLAIYAPIEFQYEMERQFNDAGLNEDLPFNNTHAGDIEYCDEVDYTTNAKRMQWVRDHVNLGE